MSSEMKKVPFSSEAQSPAGQQNIRTKFSNLVFDRQENSKLHNPYEDEVRKLDAIAQGDLETLETFWTYHYGDSYGTLAKNHLRNIKNLCIGNIVLSSRAACRGGVSPEIAFSLVDVYIQQLEEQSTASAIVELLHGAEIHFTQLVQDARKKAEDESVCIIAHIENCKNFIYSHMHEKLTVQQVADALHLNPNYLSTIFKRQEGTSILQYILSCKIRLAKNLLVYSDYTFSEIASYLGFSSQSHLGTHFKKSTGMTIGEYRYKYKNPDFIDASSEMPEKGINFPKKP